MHGVIHRRHIAKRLGAEQDTDPIGEGAEAFGTGSRIAQFGETLVHEWMLDEL